MQKIRQVLRLRYEAQLSARQIARSLNVSKQAVADYLVRAEAAGLRWPLPAELDDAQLEAMLFPATPPVPHVTRKPKPNWVEIHEALQHKGATLRGLHDEYLADHADGLSYSQFCYLYSEFARTLKRYMRQPHVAGERAYVDYAGPTVPIVDPKTGEIREAQIFVGVLGASNFIYAEAHHRQDLEHWIAAHTRMFAEFGGVPAIIVCDNLKAAVTKAHRHAPEIHATYRDLADHYRTAILPARPYKPKDKAKVENAVQVVERWILFRLRKRLFTSLGELNVAIRELLDDVNNRPFQKLAGSRREALERLDRPALQPLPPHPYQFARFRKVRVDLSYHVEIDKHLYSVPHTLCRKEVDARITADIVEVFHAGRRVASHPRSDVAGAKTTDPQHMDPTHRHFAQWDAERELDWARTIGPCTHAFLQVLLERAGHRDLGYRAAQSLKSLEREFGGERLEAACRRGMEIAATSTQSIRSILRTRLDQQVLPEPAGTEIIITHTNLRGAEYYH